MPDDPLTLYGKIKSRLDSTKFALYDGTVPATPAQAYVVSYPSPGLAYAGRMTGSHNRLQVDLRLVCAGRSNSQCINTVRIVRDLLADWRPDDALAASPLVEQNNDASVIKDESDLQDVRYSYTIHYRMHTARSQQ